MAEFQIGDLVMTLGPAGMRDCTGMVTGFCSASPNGVRVDTFRGGDGIMMVCGFILSQKFVPTNFSKHSAMKYISTVVCLGISFTS